MSYFPASTPPPIGLKADGTTLGTPNAGAFTNLFSYLSSHLVFKAGDQSPYGLSAGGVAITDASSSSELLLTSHGFFGGVEIDAFGSSIALSSSYAVILSGPKIYIGSNFETDTPLTRSGAGILYQVNGTNAQAFWVANTDDGAGNYERGGFDWQAVSNQLTIGAVAGGTGTLRGVQLIGASLQFGSNSSTEIGFYGTTPVAQYVPNQTTGGYVANTSANVVYAETTFTGGSAAPGTTAISIGDIVCALKKLGMLPA
jgi:hypothetical protein